MEVGHQPWEPKLNQSASHGCLITALFRRRAPIWKVTSPYAVITGRQWLLGGHHQGDGGRGIVIKGNGQRSSHMKATGNERTDTDAKHSKKR